MITRFELSILYVEDEPDGRELVAKMVKTKYPDATIYLAGDGRQGLDLFIKHRPDLLITDLNMPLLDGISLAKEAKSIDPDLFIMAVTASSETRALLDSIEVGINSYVLKPVDYAHLWRGIDRCIEMKYLKQHIFEQDEHIRTLSRAVEESPCAVVISDAEGTIEYANPCFTRLTGFEPEEVRGKSLKLLETSGISSEVSGPWVSFVSRQEWRGEYLSQAKDGEFFWASASSSPIYDAAGTLTHFVIIKEEITERKLAENSLVESRTRFMDLYNNAPVLLASLDRYGKIKEVNDHFLEHLGYSREEVLGRKIYEFLIASAPLFTDEIAIPEFFQDSAGVRIPYQLVKKTGETVDFLISTKIRRNYLGEIVRSVVAITDVTGQRRSRELLQDAEGPYRYLFEHSNMGLILSTSDGKIVEANPEACRIFDRSREELARSNRSELFCGEYPHLSAHLEEKIRSGFFSGRVHAIRKDGSILPVEVSSTIGKNRDGHKFSTIVLHDVGSRRGETATAGATGHHHQYTA